MSSYYYPERARAVIARMRAAIALLDAQAPNGAIDRYAPTGGITRREDVRGIHKVTREELEACYEALETWRAAQMRAEVEQEQADAKWAKENI